MSLLPLPIPLGRKRVMLRLSYLLKCFMEVFIETISLLHSCYLQPCTSIRDDDNDGDVLL